MFNELRVVTTNLEVVKVLPMAYEADKIRLCCVAIDKDGIIYRWGNARKQGEPKDIIISCNDTDVSDEDLLISAKELLREFSF